MDLYILEFFDKVLDVFVVDFSVKGFLFSLDKEVFIVGVDIIEFFGLFVKLEVELDEWL